MLPLSTGICVQVDKLAFTTQPEGFLLALDIQLPLMLAVGKLRAGPIPFERTSDSSVGEACRDSLIAAGRGLSDEASELGDTQGLADQAARDLDSNSQQDASSVEGRVTAHADRDSNAAASVNQSARSKAGSLSDEQTGEQAVGGRVPCISGVQHSACSSTSQQSSKSVYTSPCGSLPSLSSMSQVCAAELGVEKRESNPMYACSSSSASVGKQYSLACFP